MDFFFFYKYIKGSTIEFMFVLRVVRLQQADGVREEPAPPPRASTSSYLQ